jgi:hypothetical protein
MLQMFKTLTVTGTLAGALVLGGAAPVQASGTHAMATTVAVDAPTDAVLVFGPYSTATEAAVKAVLLERDGYDTRVVVRFGLFYVLAE